MNSPTEIKPSRTLIIATAGHVDHGKTALVKHLTGTNTDTLEEEKSRGLTINLGYAYHHFQNQNGNNTLGFVDVPGHTDFINNMLAGVGGVGAAMLVVAADDGIMPQTREHLAVVDLLGISTGIIVLTKTDRCDNARISAVTDEIDNLVANTGLAGAPVFPVSNVSAEGIEPLKEHLKKLIDSLESDELEADRRRTRYLIDRSFNVKGLGTVVTGVIRAGRIQEGDSLFYTQTGKSSRIKSLRLDTTNVISASMGQRVAANINLDQGEVTRGEWLIDPVLNHNVSRIDTKLTLLDSTQTLKNNVLYHLHIGANHELTYIQPLDSDKNLYQLKLKSPIHCHYGDRFVIRDPASSSTIGGGKVIDIFVPRRQRRGVSRLAFLRASDQNDEAALREIITIQADGLDFDQYEICRNLSEVRSKELLLAVEPDVRQLHTETNSYPILLSNRFYDLYREKICQVVAIYHQENPSQKGISEPMLSKLSEIPGSFRLFQSILGSMLEQQQLTRTGTLIHANNHRTALSREEEEFIAKIRPILLKSGSIPPRTRELVEMTGIQLSPLERILKQTTKAGSLIQVADNRHYLPETILELAEFTEALMSESLDDEGFSVIQFRDRSGIGRNLCIEILEYFDNVGFTRRDGNSRFVRTAKENIFGQS